MPRNARVSGACTRLPRQACAGARSEAPVCRTSSGRGAQHSRRAAAADMTAAARAASAGSVAHGSAVLERSASAGDARLLSWRAWRCQAGDARPRPQAGLICVRLALLNRCHARARGLCVQRPRARATPRTASVVARCRRRSAAPRRPLPLAGASATQPRAAARARRGRRRRAPSAYSVAAAASARALRLVY